MGKPMFRHGDYVLYRDAEAYLSGTKAHTTVCRVEAQDAEGVAAARSGWAVPVRVLASGERRHVPGDFLRRVDPAEVMRDIDTAPLDGGDVSGLESAAVAWLRQQAGGR